MGMITKDNVLEYGFVNLDALSGPVRGVVADCHGYTDTSTFTKSPLFARELGERGILYVFPYYDPWAWAKPSCYRYIDETVAAARGAAGAEEGRRLYEVFVEKVRAHGVEVGCGIFQTHMEVEILNDGPVTLILETERK